LHLKIYLKRSIKVLLFLHTMSIKLIQTNKSSFGKVDWSSNDSIFFTIMSDQEDIGEVEIKEEFDNVEILSIHIDSKERGQGYAIQTIKSIFDLFKVDKIYLEFSSSSKGFWSKIGAKKVDKNSIKMCLDKKDFLSNNKLNEEFSFVPRNIDKREKERENLHKQFIKQFVTVNDIEFEKKVKESLRQKNIKTSGVVYHNRCKIKDNEVDGFTDLSFYTRKHFHNVHIFCVNEFFGHVGISSQPRETKDKLSPFICSSLAFEHVYTFENLISAIKKYFEEYSYL